MDGMTGEEIRDAECIEDVKKLSSVQLMRNSILHSIPKKPSMILDNPEKYRRREEFSNPSQPGVEIKFLKNRCSSFGSSKSSSSEANIKETKLPSEFFTSSNVELRDSNKPSSPNLSELINSDFYETSEEFSKGESSSENEHFDQSANSTTKSKSSSKNSLKLACRNLSGSIFEDCSTYNISYPDSSPEIRNNYNNIGIFTNSLADSYSEASSIDQKSYLTENLSDTGSKPLHSNSRQNGDSSPDDPPSLCDTFFTHVVNEGKIPTPSNQSPNLSHMNRKTPVNESYSNIQTKKEDGVKEQVEGAEDTMEYRDGRRSSKRIRKRNRKGRSRNPLTYECPKCGVSYVIASDVPKDGAHCLHCDFWISVEPEFLKKEKLTWNTCRVC